jgi:alpha-beta hydrolase superfamily lysophospholipase
MEILVWTFIILITLVGIIAGILFSFYFLQEKLIFNPIRLPKDYHYPFKDKFEEHFIEVDPGVFLNCLHFRAEKPKGVIFYIHGNGDNLRYWGDLAPFFLEHQYDVFMYDFRGFGKSDGKIKGERNLQRDAKHLYHHLKKEYEEEDIIIYGFSLGTGIAARLGSKNIPKMLILEAPYYNFISLVNYHKAYLPASLISKYYFRINRYLPEVKCPLYIFHGTEDRKVPFYLGAKLKETNSNMAFIAVKDATHNDMQSMEVYRREMAKILNEE